MRNPSFLPPLSEAAPLLGVLGLVLILTSGVLFGAAPGGDRKAAAAAPEEESPAGGTSAGGTSIGETSTGPEWNRIASLLADGQVVFGIFSGEKTPETAREMARQSLADFVFYSMETGPFDIPEMAAYQEALSPAEGRGPANPHPLALRIPPLRDGREQAAERSAAGLDAGAYAIVFPHVETAAEAEYAVASMRPRRVGGLRGDFDPEAARVFGVSAEDYAAHADVWPLAGSGELISMVLIEDRVGVANALEIVSVPGVSVAFPGPGDLRRAYGGDRDAVEAAIQTVLSACQQVRVPCGITAGPEDIAARIEQGFRVFIVTSPEALAVGHRAAGRRVGS